MATPIERQTMRKVYWRILPFTFILYLICYLDRVNIGFAALTMNKDLGLSSYIYGLGAGAFFWGYFLLEVPSNLILEHDRGGTDPAGRSRYRASRKSHTYRRSRRRRAAPAPFPGSTPWSPRRRPSL